MTLVSRNGSYFYVRTRNSNSKLKDCAVIKNSTSTLRIGTFVSSGRGLATEARQDDLKELSELCGIAFVSGSLNLLSKRPVWLVPEYAIYRKGSFIFWEASLGGLPVVIGRWLSGCPAHVFEVFAAQRLRDKLALRDGDGVTLEISRNIVSLDQSTLWAKTVWALFWKFRENQVYSDGKYWKLVTNSKVWGYAWRGMQRGSAGLLRKS